MTVCDPVAGSGELALRKHGLTGEKLLRMAYAIANGYARRTGSGLDSRLDDLAQHLALTATRRALLYDPAKNPNSTFTSYLWDIMEPACIDWHRRKAEGFGDRRYGHDNRVDLAGDTTGGEFQTPPGDISSGLLSESEALATEHDEIMQKIRGNMANQGDTQRLGWIIKRLEKINDQQRHHSWRLTAWLIQQPLHQWPVVHERRVLRWQRAADQADLPLDQFIVRAADVYAQVMERRAA